MIEADKQGFKIAFNRLAVETQLSPDRADRSMQRIYFEGLEDLSLEAVTLAAHEIGLKSSWFPKLAEWREAAKLHEQVIRLRALPAPREEPWHHECRFGCEDTGWMLKRCRPGTGEICGRTRCASAGGKTHDYCVPCECRPTNGTYQRRWRSQLGIGR